MLPEWLQVKTTTMGGRNRVGMKVTDRRCGSFSWRGAGYHQVGADWLDAAGASLRSYDCDWVNERFAWAEKHPGLGYPWLDHWN